MKRAVLIIILLISAGHEGCTDVGTTASFEFDSQIDRVVVDVTSGSIQISSSVSQKTVEVDFNHRSEEVIANTQVYLSSRTLYIIDLGVDPDGIGSSILSVLVPFGIEADLRINNGQVNVEQFQGKLRIAICSGNVSLESVNADITISGGGSDIFGYGIKGGTTDIELVRGDIFLDYDMPPTSFFANVGVGSVGLSVPKGEYSVLNEVGQGNMQIDGLINKANAEKMIDIEVESGAVGVTGTISDKSEISQGNI